MSSNDNQDSIKVELAVQMKCDSCAQRITEALNPLDGIKIEDISVPDQRIILSMSTQSDTVHSIQTLIETQLGMKTVIKGIGESSTSSMNQTNMDQIKQVSAVSEIRGYDDMIGVVRMTQMRPTQCLIDGVIDGLRKTNIYELNIHEYGDLSGTEDNEDSFPNVGNVILPLLSKMTVNDDSYPTRSTFKCQIKDCDLNAMIGRSMGVKVNERNGSPVVCSEVIGAGIVARASSVGDNSKKICACDGKTLWQERNHAREDRTSRL